ncbi:hypothetical protein, partial [Aeromonas caviae]|uniref:hypothetical protein n=1 Tax=Aeromonas caviae TaxID=648 RepID=UPI0020B16623
IAARWAPGRKKAHNSQPLGALNLVEVIFVADEQLMHFSVPHLWVLASSASHIEQADIPPAQEDELN